MQSRLQLWYCSDCMHAPRCIVYAYRSLSTAARQRPNARLSDARRYLLADQVRPRAMTTHAFRWLRLQFKYLEAQWKAAGLPVNPFVDLHDSFDAPYERVPGTLAVPEVEDGLLQVSESIRLKAAQPWCTPPLCMCAPAYAVDT